MNKNSKDSFWRFQTMLRVRRVLEKARKEVPERLLSREQIIKAAFPEAIGSKTMLEFANSKVVWYLGRSLAQKIIEARTNRFEDPEVVYYSFKEERKTPNRRF